VANCLKRPEVVRCSTIGQYRQFVAECILHFPRASSPSMRRTSRLNKTPLISIVDDDSVVRGAIESLVTALGFLACTFPSAEAFLQSQLVAETSCLISDVQLPGTSGIELRDRLADLGFSIPTIFITAYPNDAVRARVLDAGAVCFLEKPFDGQSLIQCIDNALDRRAKK
jgi:FixJ family two-component response regulator